MKIKYLFYLILIFVALVIGCTKKATTKGKILGTTMNPLIGYNWEAKSWYKFEVDGKDYVDTIYFCSDEKVLIEGEVIKVTYNTENPEENEIMY
tara:strand:+ start:1349 stop:1630 length:282 start_codon:yes stop_codon:yes gene_type:complete